MSSNKKPLKPHEILLDQFLEKSGNHRDISRVLRSTTYEIGQANVLVRVASTANRRYFFGINYLTIEDLSNLKNPFIAFVCGSIERTVIVPATELFKNIKRISHDRNGEYKLNIDANLNIVLAGRGNRMNCQHFINKWEFFNNPPPQRPSISSSVEESMHAVLQGRLIEIGNIRGFSTFCPDKKKTFNDKKLEEISNLEKCPELQFSDYSLLRKIDVIWFRYRGNHHIPECAFEVELTTGVWSGVGRMATLIDYTNTNLYVVTNDRKKYNQVLGTVPEHQDRYQYLPNDLLGELYAAEINLITLRKNIGL